MEYSPLSNESFHCAIRCKVIRSFPSTGISKRPNYDVSTCLSKVTGNEFAAHCTCTTGYVQLVIIVVSVVIHIINMTCGDNSVQILKVKRKITNQKQTDLLKKIVVG